MFEFSEFDENRQINVAGKRTFILTPRNMDLFLNVDLDAKFEEDEEPQISFYKPRDSEVTTIMRLSRDS